MDREGRDQRRFPRFDFGGTALLVFDDPEQRRTLAITNYRNISKAGACVITPDAQRFEIGDQIYLMLERYRRKREAVIVNQSTGRLHLDIPHHDEFTDFELAEAMQRFQFAAER